MLINKTKHIILKKEQVIVLGLVLVVLLTTIILNIFLPNDPNKLKATIAPSNGDYLFKITVIDYGSSTSGDAVLLESNGKYLLMDTGGPEGTISDNGAAIIQYLKSKSINKFDVYISHYDPDHHYYLKYILADNYFNITNIYLPDITNVKDACDNFETYNGSYFNTDIDNYSNLLATYCGSVYGLGEGAVHTVKNSQGNIVTMDLGNNEIGGYLHNELKKTKNVIYLTKGSKITIGKAKLEVLWHNVNKNQLTMDYYKNIDATAPYDFYLKALADGKRVDGYNKRAANNISLVSMISAGNKKYFTAGDIQFEVERELLHSGINLHADVMKMNHHGIGTSNTDNFLQAVSPTYAFYQLNIESTNQSYIPQQNINDYIDTDLQYYLWGRPYYNAQFYSKGVYGVRYNGNTTFTFDNYDVDVSTQQNYHIVTVNYINNSTNKIIKTKTTMINDSSYHEVDKKLVGYDYVSGLENATRKKYTSNVTYNARYNQKSVNVTYHINYGTDTTATQTFTSGVQGQKFGKITGTDTPIWGAGGQFSQWDRVGFTLIGWSTNPNATSAAYQGAYYNVDDYFIESTSPSVDLYAIWQPKTVNVTYHINYGTDTTATQTFTSGVQGQKFGKITGTDTPIWGAGGQFSQWDRDGYTLIGWSKNPNATTATYQGAYYSVNDEFVQSTSPSVDLYAVWVSKQVTITFHINYGSTDKTATQTFEMGISNQAFGKNPDGSYKWGNTGQFGGWDQDGYLLIGWSTDPDAVRPTYSEIYYSVNDNFVLSNNSVMDLYAIWKKQVTITFHRNYGSTDKTATQTFTAGVPNQQFGYCIDEQGQKNPCWAQTGQFGGWDREGYKLAGWGTSPTSQTILYELYYNVTNTFINKYDKEKDLYAVWNKITSIPTCSSKTYNRQKQTLFEAHTSGDYTNAELSGTNAGNYTVTVTPTPNHEWSDGTTESKNITCKIKPYNLSNATIVPISDYTYDGTAKEPVPSVLVNGATLNSTDYDVTYSNNINIGTANITITGKGNYTGEKTSTFNIVVDVSKLNIKENTYVILNKDSTKDTITELIETNVSIFRNDVEINNTSKLATGDILRISNKEYIIVILGDTNKDGKVNIADLTRTYKIYKKTYTPNEIEFYAADSNEDERINISDLTRTYKIYKNN